MGKNSYTVTNSTDFVHRIQDVHNAQGDLLVSFDVSLFTQVPVDEALHVLEERLNGDQTLEERTSIPVAQVIHLTELCLRSTFFQFGDHFYEQTDGAAMGSPISPIMANLFMEYIEEKAITSAPLKPNMWTRYVDDTFVIWPHGPELLQKFHEHLNQQCPNIRFTMEIEDGGQIPFLDVLITRKGNKLSTSVYRKPTHTDRYLPSHSHHHPKMLTGVMQCMGKRAHQICDEDHKQAELHHLEKVFIANGYPERTVKRTFSSADKTREKDASTEEDPAKPLFLSYVRGVSEKLEKACAPLGVKTIFRPQKTLRRTLMQMKERTPLEKRNLVYEVPCHDCQLTYVGETKRSMKKRPTEHRYAVKTGDPKNGIAVHVQKSQHTIDWGAARVQATAIGYWNRRTMEAIQIRRRQSMNLDCGLHLSPVWNPFIDAT